jgi:hypothetical protein
MTSPAKLSIGLQFPGMSDAELDQLSPAGVFATLLSVWAKLRPLPLVIALADPACAAGRPVYIGTQRLQTCWNGTPSSLDFDHLRPIAGL